VERSPADVLPSGVLLSGRPLRRAALCVVLFGTALFGAAAIAVLAHANTPVTVRIVIGSVLTLAAAATVPLFMLDAASREHVLTDRSLICRHGFLRRHEIEVPYAHIRAVGIAQGFLPRWLGCGDVSVVVGGIGGAAGMLTSSQELSAIRLRSIPDHDRVGRLLRERLGWGAD
jgi:uncharacterized membrane protein YdbT with pleckstrin-like domain